MGEDGAGKSEGAATVSAGKGGNGPGRVSPVGIRFCLPVCFFLTESICLEYRQGQKERRRGMSARTRRYLERGMLGLSIAAFLVAVLGLYLSLT